MRNSIENIESIAYMQAAESYSILVNKSGKKILKSKPMKHFESSFLLQGWLRVHRSYLVNPLFVSHISEDRDYILLNNGTKLPIARRKLRMVSRWRSSTII